MHGNVGELILTNMVKWAPDNVIAVGPWIYGIKEENLSFFINRPINIDLGNNGNDHRKNLESNNTHNKNTVYQKCRILGGVDT